MPDNTLYKTALTKAMALCSRREYCIDDIQNKLQLWGVDNSDARKIISALVKENFINESRYATAYVRDKFKYNKWGKVKIASHLKSRKIPANAINSALNALDNEVYTKAVKDIILVHRKTLKAKNQYDLKAKLLRYGLSKGFESSLLYDILNDLED